MWPHRPHFARRPRRLAERTYQREFRMLEQYYKTHCPKAAAPKPPKEAEKEPEKEEEETLDIYMEDDTSRTGETFLHRFSGPRL